MCIPTFSPNQSHCCSYSASSSCSPIPRFSLHEIFLYNCKASSIPHSFPNCRVIKCFRVSFSFRKFLSLLPLFIVCGTSSRPSYLKFLRHLIYIIVLFYFRVVSFFCIYMRLYSDIPTMFWHGIHCLVFILLFYYIKR